MSKKDKKVKPEIENWPYPPTQVTKASAEKSLPPQMPGQQGIPPSSSVLPIAILYHPRVKKTVYAEAEVPELIEIPALKVPAVVLYSDGSTAPWGEKTH